MKQYNNICQEALIHELYTMICNSIGIKLLKYYRICNTLRRDYGKNKTTTLTAE